MFFLDKPYISDFLKMTVLNHAIPVVDTASATKLDLNAGTSFISEKHAMDWARKQDNPLIYTNSENAIGWIATHLPFTDLPAKINLFKDKLKFRELTTPLFPDFFETRSIEGSLFSTTGCGKREFL